MISDKDTILGVTGSIGAAIITVTGTIFGKKWLERKAPADVAKVIADAFKVLVDEVQEQNKSLQDEVAVLRKTGHENRNSLMVLQKRVGLMAEHTRRLENCLQDAGITAPQRPAGLEL